MPHNLSTELVVFNSETEDKNVRCATSAAECLVFWLVKNELSTTYIINK